MARSLRLIFNYTLTLLEKEGYLLDQRKRARERGNQTNRKSINMFLAHSAQKHFLHNIIPPASLIFWFFVRKGFHHQGNVHLAFLFFGPDARVLCPLSPVPVFYFLPTKTKTSQNNQKPKKKATQRRKLLESLERAEEGS